MRRTPWLVVLGVTALAGCTATTTSVPSSSSTTGSGGPAGTQVTISVSDLTGSQGSELAAILYQGSRAGGVVDNAPGLGGYRVTVDTDPFAVSKVLQQGSPLASGGASQAAAVVPAGTQTLGVFVGQPLTAASEWVPATPDRGCYVKVEIPANAATLVVHVSGVQKWNRGHPATCSTM